MRLYLLEPDDPGAAWAPFSGVRPVAELRDGARTIRQRWERLTGIEDSAIIGSDVEGFVDPGSAPVVPPEAIVGECWVADATFAPLDARAPTSGARRLIHDHRPVAWRLDRNQRWEGPHDAGAEVEVGGRYLGGVTDLLDALERTLPRDLEDLAQGWDPIDPEGALILGDAGRVALRGAAIEPGVTFDVRAGPVVVDGAEVRNGSRLEGPLYVGPGTVILGGYLRRSVFGPQCRVRGEVSHSIFMGFGNKAHDGFVGHSIVGQWVNLGALTTTSNLKNTYGTVRLECAGERWDSGRQFLGSLIGDHAKTAIGTMLGTGTIIGAGANVFGGEVPKYVPPLAWGVTGERTREEGFLRVAERVMSRRGVAWSSEREASLRAIYARLARS